MAAMARGGLLGVVPLLALLVPPARCAAPLAVWGYVPEYRFAHLDWEHALTHTTHLVLFSVEPTAEGGLAHTERLAAILRPRSPLMTALDKLGGSAAKLIVSIGGAGRSAQWPAAASTARKTFAARIGEFFDKYPILAGVDMDWETPGSAQQWRDLGKFAKGLREVLAEKLPQPPVLSMTYHPRSGSVQAFGPLRGKKSDKAFVDIFDAVHSMAYSQFDSDRKHSTPRMDAVAIEEWVAAGLPLEKLSLGMPFFGVARKTAQAKTFADIFAAEPSLMDRLGDNEAQGGVYFPNARSLVEKVNLARASSLGGVMIWELGQDAPSASGASLLSHVWAAARHGTQLTATWREVFITRMHAFRDDHVFGILAAVLGAYYLVQVFSHDHVRHKLQPPPKPKKTEEKEKARERNSATSEAAAAAEGTEAAEATEAAEE